MEQKRKTTYINRIGDTTFIVINNFTGNKTISDAFEEIILNAFRSKYSEMDAENTDIRYDPPFNSKINRVMI